MPSADFCLLTRYVAIQGAVGFLMRRCLFRVSLEDSYPPTAIGHAGFLVFRVNPFRTLLMSILPHGKQISPDKDVLARQSATARRRELSVHKRRIYLAPRTCGLCCVVPTRPGAKPYMRFLFPGSSPGQAMARTFAIGLPSDPSSRRRPPILGIFDLPSARTFGSIH